MKDGPNIVGIAALIGDRARADILTALMGGQALTATELAQVAGVTKQTVSAHLAKLLDGGAASPSRARAATATSASPTATWRRLLESLMGVAYRAGAVRLRSEPARAGAAQGARLLRPPRGRSRRAGCSTAFRSAACCAGRRAPRR